MTPIKQLAEEAVTLARRQAAWFDSVPASLEWYVERALETQAQEIQKKFEKDQLNAAGERILNRFAEDMVAHDRAVAEALERAKQICDDVAGICKGAEALTALHCADAISALIPRSDLVCVQRWIPVSERLPEKGSFVWAWDAERGANPSAFLADGLWVITYDDAAISPTHWMPLPAPPTIAEADKEGKA